MGNDGKGLVCLEGALVNLQTTGGVAELGKVLVELGYTAVDGRTTLALRRGCRNVDKNVQKFLHHLIA